MQKVVNSSGLFVPGKIGSGSEQATRSEVVFIITPLAAVTSVCSADYIFD